MSSDYDYIKTIRKYDRIMITISIIMVIISFLLGYNMGSDNKTVTNYSKINYSNKLYHYYTDIGYCDAWATELALVESGLKPISKEYNSIKED